MQPVAELPVKPRPVVPVKDVSARLVPAHNWRAHWLTVTEFSLLVNRSPDRVHGWVREGVLAEFGIPVYRVCVGKRHSGRTFIQNVY